MKEKLLPLRKLQHETSRRTKGCGVEAGTPDSLFTPPLQHHRGRNRPPFMTTSRSKIHQELNKNKHKNTTRGYSEILGAE